MAQKPLEQYISNLVYGEQDQGAKQYQEDSFCIFCSPGLKIVVAAVFDGHGGLNGRLASATSRDITKRYFTENWEQCISWSDQQWRTELTNLFLALHNKIRESFIELERQGSKRPVDNIVDDKGVVRKRSGFPVHGGTTASVCIVIRQDDDTWKLICANVGDSDTLLLARKPTRLPHNIKCKHISVDHSPDNSSEYLRIKQLPEETTPLKLLFVYDKADSCRKYECPIVFLSDGTKDPQYVQNPWGNDLRTTNVRYDPAVYAVSPRGVTQDITCIAMTRSLGDFYAHQFGLSCVPDVTIETLPMKNEYLVTIGSDGIWDCWRWDDFADYVNGTMSKHSNQLSQTVRTVLCFSVQRAKACFGESSYDDSTLIILNLNERLFPS